MHSLNQIVIFTLQHNKTGLNGKQEHNTVSELNLYWTTPNHPSTIWLLKEGCARCPKNFLEYSSYSIYFLYYYYVTHISKCDTHTHTHTHTLSLSLIHIHTITSFWTLSFCKSTFQSLPLFHTYPAPCMIQFHIPSVTQEYNRVPPGKHHLFKGLWYTRWEEACAPMMMGPMPVVA
jgi:hypothetical protein